MKQSIEVIQSCAIGEGFTMVQKNHMEMLHKGIKKKTQILLKYFCRMMLCRSDKWVAKVRLLMEQRAVFNLTRDSSNICSLDNQKCMPTLLLELPCKTKSIPIQPWKYFVASVLVAFSRFCNISFCNHNDIFAVKNRVMRAKLSSVTVLNFWFSPSPFGFVKAFERLQEPFSPCPFILL